MTKVMNTTSDTPCQSEWGLFLPPLERNWAELPTDQTASLVALQTALQAAPTSRKRRVDWVGTAFNALWMALMLSCTGVCVCRLLWAAQA